ncbi:MAG: hypothetical protein BCV62_21600 [Pseudomonas sp. K35]|uniref:Uncharacterized protein n=1 Tax=Stutzerimonas stutzeri TaxID=316 RepID=A0A0D7DYC3_STUST|nr:hypothetical protein LO50_21490 [Stutzerimonas stutzeri]OCX98033.1 MAG: hypothetical protein BCV62_21600 [Pseudomonas sp. K35]
MSAETVRAAIAHIRVLLKAIPALLKSMPIIHDVWVHCSQQLGSLSASKENEIFLCYFFAQISDFRRRVGELRVKHDGILYIASHVIHRSS